MFLKTMWTPINDILHYIFFRNRTSKTKGSKIYDRDFGSMWVSSVLYAQELKEPIRRLNDDKWVEYEHVRGSVV